MKKKRIRWIKTISRNVTPQASSIITSPNSRFFEKLGVGFKNQLYIPENGKHIFYLDADEFRTFGEEIARKIKSDKNFLKNQIKACLRDSRELFKVSKECSKAVKRKTEKVLIKDYKNYLDKFYDFYVHMWATHPIEDYLEDTLKITLKEELERRKKKDRFNQYLRVLTEKTGLIEAEKEQIGFLEIAVRGKTTREIDKLLDKHVKKYSWLPFYGFDLPVWDKMHFLNNLREIKNPNQRLKKTKKELKEKRERLKKVKKELKENKELIELINLVQKYLVLRTDRADVYRKGIYFLRPFLFEIAKRAKLSYMDVVYLTPNEIINFLEKDRLPKHKLIKERQKHFLLISKWGKVRLVSETKTIQKIIKEELGEEEVKITKLRGKIAFPGVVKGKVRIIKTIKDIKKINKGNVLVTSMTTPDMTIGIHKAAALVTDEGGITCHAAIVSREFGIPCIIATKIATKVFKDGDLVEVDAERGFVRKLEK